MGRVNTTENQILLGIFNDTLCEDSSCVVFRNLYWSLIFEIVEDVEQVCKRFAMGLKHY